MIYAVENSNKFPKNQVLERKSSWRCGNTCANGTCHTSLDDIVNRLHPINNYSTTPLIWGLIDLKL
jgi:hypothetical protein